MSLVFFPEKKPPPTDLFTPSWAHCFQTSIKLRMRLVREDRVGIAQATPLAWFSVYRFAEVEKSEIENTIVSSVSLDYKDSDCTTIRHIILNCSNNLNIFHFILQVKMIEFHDSTTPPHHLWAERAILSDLRVITLLSIGS